MKQNEKEEQEKKSSNSISNTIFVKLYKNGLQVGGLRGNGPSGLFDKHPQTLTNLT